MPVPPPGPRFRLIFFKASLLIADLNPVNRLPVLGRTSRPRNIYRQEGERGVLVRATPVAVLADHDPGLVRVQFQADPAHPLPRAAST